MALIRTREIRAMRPEDIKLKFKELEDELMHERGVAAMGGAPASPGRIRAIRTNIARIHTIMREMHIEEAARPKGAPAEKERAEVRAEPRRATKPRPKKGKEEKEKKEEQEEKK